MIVAIIPAYNEEKTLGGVLEKVKLFVDKIIVVNDGSTDKTAEIAKSTMKSDFRGKSDFCDAKKGNKVLNHIINRGLGAALRTGFVAALRENANIIVTLDADGQHSAEDIPRLIAPIQNGEADVVIGSRFLKPSPSYLPLPEGGGGKVGVENPPLFRKFANFLGNIITFLLFGIWTSDSQSGFRAFSREALKKINLKSSGMEVSSEIIKEIKKNNLRLKEIPIKSVYTKYSMSKGQNFLEGVKTVIQLILRKIERD